MTSTEYDLLAAIIAEPADDTPRYALADLWEEKGDPRGEFMRVQLRLAELNYETNTGFCKGSDCTCAQIKSLLCTELRLFEGKWLDFREAKLREPWREGVRVNWRLLQHTAPIDDAVTAIFRRGFVGELVCEGDFWVYWHATIRKNHPVNRVRLTTWPGVEHRRSLPEHVDEYRLSLAPSVRHWVSKRELLMMRGDAVRSIKLRTIYTELLSELVHRCPIEHVLPDESNLARLLLG